ncbi:MAG TPA: AAA family ATPase [Candidatus Dormibacteraeota bacterium]|nr:AAA family ATPase [Candidatus Dormibacteraeota bacterium]
MQEIAAAARSERNPLLDRIVAHLGADPAQVPVTLEQFDTFEQPNLQVALEAYLSREGHSAELIGVSMQNKRFMAIGLSELITRGSVYGTGPLVEGPVDYMNFHLANDEVLACVQFGLYLISAGQARLAVLVTGPSEMGDPRGQKLRLEVMATQPDDGRAFVAEVRLLADEQNVYRGHAISLAPGMRIGPGPHTLVEFQSLPRVERSDVVLPTGVLERIERHTITFSEHAQQLLAAGRSLKRGMLLFGLPGTGKTLTVMYLAGRMPGRTVLLTTGRGLGMVETVAKMARQLAPSMIVLEDVDLVAEERTMPGFGARPVLFELLNEMDGLRDDQDVIFVLTTNRPDILEPALAARPGRVDLAVELPLPDPDGRHRLLELYSRGLSLVGIDLDRIVASTDGATPAYIKELLRKAALRALEAGSGTDVRQPHVDGAIEELAQGGRLAERILGFRPEQPEPQSGWQASGTGFPTQVFVKRDK